MNWTTFNNLKVGDKFILLSDYGKPEAAKGYFWVKVKAFTEYGRSWNSTYGTCIGDYFFSDEPVIKLGGIK